MSPVITRFIGKLQQLNPDFCAEELADALWYAALRFDSEKTDSQPTPRKTTEQVTAQENKPDKQSSDTLPQTGHSQDSPKRDENQADFSENEFDREPSAELYPPSPPGNESSSSGLSLRVPGGRALPHPLVIARALRPLIRRKASRTRFVINEEASAQRIAQTDLWLPVIEPEQERWLELALVVEDSPSMRIWRQTAQELRELLSRQGAFRDIRLWTLKTSGKTQDISLHAENSNTSRHYKELLNPAQDRLILILSDCVSPAWQSAELIRWLNAWGRHHATHLMQLLPQSLWQKSRLREAQLLKVTAPFPAVANRFVRRQADDLDFFDEDTEASTPLPIPLTTLEPGFLRSWAKFVGGQGGIQMPAFVLAEAQLPVGTKPPDELTEAELNERLARFRAVASPMAYHLACCFAAAPLRLPIMRLVQRALLPESGQTHLAEFFLSGLIKRENPNVEINDPDKIEYEFLSDGLRDKLLEAGLVTDAVQVQKVVSEYVADHYGNAIDFMALLRNPLVIDDYSDINFGSEIFANASIAVLKMLGGQYLELAEYLLEHKEKRKATKKIKNGNGRFSPSKSEIGKSARENVFSLPSQYMKFEKNNDYEMFSIVYPRICKKIAMIFSQ